VVGGKIFRGSHTGAGEIGHVIMLPHGGKPCRCGKNGCLETLVSETVILEEAEKIIRRDPSGLLAQSWRDEKTRPIERVFQAARQGDGETRRMLEERAGYLGIALANLVNMLNPELIILGGMFAQGHDLILPAAARTMRETAFAGLGEKVRVLTTGFGWRAGVIGASALALLRYFYQQGQTIPNHTLPL
jgi:glucokinase